MKEKKERLFPARLTMGPQNPLVLQPKNENDVRLIQFRHYLVDIRYRATIHLKGFVISKSKILHKELYILRFYISIVNDLKQRYVNSFFLGHAHFTISRFGIPIFTETRQFGGQLCDQVITSKRTQWTQSRI